MSFAPRRRHLSTLVIAVLVASLAAVAAPASSQPPLTTTGHAVVPASGVQLVTVRLTGDQVRVLARNPAPGVVLPISTSIEAARSTAAATDRDDRVVAVELLDAAGRVSYRRTVSVSRYIRGELAADAATGVGAIDPHRVPAATLVTNLALPEGGDYASLRVSDPLTGRSSRVAFAPRRLVAKPVVKGGPTAVALPGFSLGNPRNRLDVAILGDGYTAAQESQFETDAAAAAKGILSISPYNPYRSMMNVVGVFAPSSQSGADHPPYKSSGCASSSSHPISCCPDSASSGKASSYVDTRYDSSFCSYGIERLLVPLDQTQVLKDAAAAYPAYDQIIVIVNDSEYGGSGGTLATTSKNPQGVQVVQHELGHSLLGLDDEYANFTPGYPACSDKAGSKLPHCDPNVTDVSTRHGLKWLRWVSPSTKIPTSSPQPSTVVGDFVGAHYSPTGYYRPCDECIMQYLGYPFGAVEAEQLPVRLYTGSVAGPGSPATGLSLIEPGSRSPVKSASGALAQGGKRTFAVAVLAAGSRGTRLTWTVDGKIRSSHDVAAGRHTFTFSSPDGHAHRVRVRASDDDGILHPTLRSISAATTSWTVKAAAPPTGQLVRNGGFEKPLAGTWRTSAGVERGCAKGLGRASRCAVRLSAGTKARILRQAVPARGVKGERLVFSGSLDPVNLRADVAALLVLRLVDGKVLRLALGGVPRDRTNATGYLTRSRSVVLPAAVKGASIKVSLGKGTGTVLVDSASLRLLRH